MIYEKQKGKIDMSYFTPDVYSVDNLKDEDKRCVDEIEYVKERVLAEDTIDEFLSEYSNSGKTTNEILKELLSPFVEYLREEIEHCICDKIISAIEDYTDEELECLMAKSKNRKEV